MARIHYLLLPAPPSFSDPDNIVFAHVRHVKAVRPCSLGKREKTIKFRAELAYLSQCLLVNKNFLKKVLNDLQLPICTGVSNRSPVLSMVTESARLPTMEV